MHQPGIEPGSVPWQGTILPLDHWCYCVASRSKYLIFDIHFPHTSNTHNHNLKKKIYHIILSYTIVTFVLNH